MKSVFVLILAIGAASAFSVGVSEEVINTPFQPSDRIVGGAAIKITEAPWQVGLSIAGTGWCGGALISTEWVLTAAHCADGYASTPTKLTVYVGSATIKSGTSRTVQKIIIHSGYNSKTIVNDIALLKITAVTLGTNVKAATLPTSTTVAAGTAVFASGWGKTSDTSGTASTLQGVTLTVISNTDCQKSFSSVSASNVCVSTVDKKSVCNGDSGGPLVISSSKVLVGLTSYGSASGCTKGIPAVFTRVGSYLSWIKTNSGV